jgi:hypothetical protein
MYEPGLAHKSTPFMDPDMIADEYEEGTDFNVYHVTTNLAGVLSSGGLKSRDELGNVGLGGGWKNEASNMISTTYDYNRALGIYHEMIYVAEIVKGKYTIAGKIPSLTKPWRNTYPRTFTNNYEMDRWMRKY